MINESYIYILLLITGLLWAIVILYQVFSLKDKDYEKWLRKIDKEQIMKDWENLIEDIYK